MNKEQMEELLQSIKNGFPMTALRTAYGLGLVEGVKKEREFIKLERKRQEHQPSEAE